MTNIPRQNNRPAGKDLWRYRGRGGDGAQGVKEEKDGGQDTIENQLELGKKKSE